MPNEFEQYICECGQSSWTIRQDHIRCSNCGKEYRVTGFASPSRFNTQKQYFRKIDFEQPSK